MYEHVCYRKKEVRARLLSQKRCTNSSVIVKKMYEHGYYRKKVGTSTSIIVKKMYVHVYYRKKDVRARPLS